MRAVAVNPGKKAVNLINVEEPHALGEGEVRLRMLEVGVCGTDREIASFQYGTPPPGSEHLVIGHESLGEVIEIGKGVTKVKPKDLVVTMVRRPCPQLCPACAAGRQDFCLTGDFTERGIKGRHGFMTEQVVDHERFMHVVPQALRDVGVLTEPLTIAEKGLRELTAINSRLPWKADVKDGYEMRALVLGAGPVGLLGAMALVERGYKTFVYSRGLKPNAKASLVESIGATYFAAEDTPVEQLPEKIGNIDVVYEATGASRLAFEVIKVVGINGVFIFTGVPGRKGPSAVDTDLLMRNLVLKNQVVYGTVNAGAPAYQGAIAALTQFDRKWPQALRALITGRFPMDSYAGLLKGGSETSIKDVIRIAA